MSRDWGAGVYRRPVSSGGVDALIRITDQGYIYGKIVEGGLEQAEEGGGWLQRHIAATEQGSEVDHRQDAQGLDAKGPGEGGGG